MVKLTENIKDNFPFISVVHYGGIEYVGIIINQDHNVTSMYNYQLLKTEEEKRQFLDFGDQWWWESNRIVPINIFMKQDMQVFRHCIVTMNSKDVTVVFGPTVNLNSMAIKRIKRKQIQLVRTRR